MNASTPTVRLLGRLAPVWLVFVLTVTGCPDNTAPCSGDEQLSVKMTGTCAPGERRLIVTRQGCAITVTSDPPLAGSDAGAPTATGLPMTGATDTTNAPLRQGGWSVWGCLAGKEPCPDQFRICSAERVDFQLNVTCVDGTGAPACGAVLTE